MNTTFLLMAQYGAVAVVPIDLVCRDYFSHLSAEKLTRKIGAGDIALPLVRMEGSQKSAKGVHVEDLAKYIDDRRAAAVKECQQLCH
ncbi:MULTISPECIES: pyocin activator PrtN family protein [Pandoraea]|uniref:Pyocin activator protein PrtN n=4 Tax=Pandoraea TaxID=93217 RepID=A0A5E4WSB6_9BURK|nr:MULTISPECIES: pyocin activator PrtN family protein [Pandoraea]MCE4059100.1 pyocin activator PrtN family protein [Pandoraea sputorum]VVE26464.1 Pyocin activator protein PrtN [Pandoraea aquatica]VVE55693.1 Pyocin activator protein PrtN [Pandoraea anhela]VVE67755.1 Pyocin activator protein PrtN [Pandoraea anapnoica]BET09377.1 pyocin activator PrtN family protein [Pandoraea sputorum]